MTSSSAAQKTVFFWTFAGSIFFLLLLLLLLLVGAGCSRGGEVAPSSMAAEVAVPSEPAPSANGNQVRENPPVEKPAESQKKSFEILASNFSFDPAEIRVKKGDTVTIRLKNAEGFHDIVVDEFGVKSVRIGEGSETSVTFVADKAGTFEYYCSIGSHRQMGMVGKLIVEESTSAAASADLSLKGGTVEFYEEAGKEFRMIYPNDGDTVTLPTSVDAYICDIYGMMKTQERNIPLYYKTFFYAERISDGVKMLLGESNGPGAGSGECGISWNDQKIVPGTYRLWAERFGAGKEGQKTPAITVSVRGYEEKQEAVSLEYKGTVLAGTKAKLLDFTKADYDAAVNSGKLVAVYFYANWCPICKEEFPKMQEAFNALDTGAVVGFRVNYNDNETDDAEKALAKEFGVAYQHTKVFVKNGTRVLKSPESWEKGKYLEEIREALK